MKSLGTASSRVASWVAAWVAARFAPESAERAAYRASQGPIQQRIMVLVATGNLVLAPVYFWLDVRAVRTDAMTVSMAVNYVLVHVWVVLMSLSFLTFTWRSRTAASPSVWGRRYVTVAVAHVVLVATVLAILNQYRTGSVTIFVTATFGLVVAARIRPTWVSAWVITGAAAIFVATWTITPEVSTALTAQFNVALAVTTFVLMYPYYDRLRFDAFRQQRQLDRLLSVKDAVLRALGHDLRAPVVELRRLARVLEDPNVDWVTERDSTVDRLEGLADYTALVIDNVTAAGSDVSDGVDTGAVASLAESFDRAVRLVRRNAVVKSIDLLVDLDDDVMVACDLGQVTFVLHNLLHNAVKFTPDGRRVTLAAEIRRDSVVVSVRDEGIGFSRSVLAGIERGEWISGSHGTRGETGTGLGLGVTRPLLRSMGASLSIDVQPGGGTHAWFELRRYRATDRSQEASGRAVVGARVSVVGRARREAST